MTNTRQLVDLVVHYGPSPTPGLPPYRRVAVCGTEYRVGGEVFGSSRLSNVTCCVCLEMVRKATGSVAESEGA